MSNMVENMLLMKALSGGKQGNMENMMLLSALSGNNNNKVSPLMLSLLSDKGKESESNSTGNSELQDLLKTNQKLLAEVQKSALKRDELLVSINAQNATNSKAIEGLDRRLSQVEQTSKSQPIKNR